MLEESFLSGKPFFRQGFSFNLKEGECVSLLKAFSECQEQNIKVDLDLEALRLKALYVRDFMGFKFHFFSSGRGVIYGYGLTARSCEGCLFSFFNSIIVLCIENVNH